MGKNRVISCVSVIVAASFFALFYASVLSRTSPITWARLKSIDSLYHWRANLGGRLPALSQILIVGIDDDSYRRMNLAWPWGRDIFAAFLDELEKARPRTVTLDFSFVGRSRPDADTALADSIAAGGNVVLAGFLDREGRHIPPLEELREAADAWGFVDKPLDRDAVNRRTRVVTFLNDSAVYSLGAELAAHFLGKDVADFIDPKDRHVIFRYPGGRRVDVSLNARHELWISYRYRSDKFDYLPFWQIASGRFPHEKVRGRIVMVGPVSSIFHDIHMTPLGQMPGIFVNANEMLTLADADFLNDALSPVDWLLFLIGVAAVSAALFFFLSWVGGLVLLVGVGAAFYALSAYLFCGRNLILEPFSALVMPAVAYTAVLIQKSTATFLDNMALQRLVATDALTGLYGPQFLRLRLDMEFKQSREKGGELSFAMIDIDLFKKVNDTYGHEKGNEVLIEIGRLLKQGVRGEDVVARYGGEEFSIIFAGQNEQIARQAMERIRKDIEDHPFESNGVRFQVTVSAGIANNQKLSSKNAKDLVQSADQALYKAKSQGRNQVVLA